MLNQQELAGNWNQVKGALKKKWANLSDDDLISFNGNVDTLVGNIQHATGATRESIEAFLDHASEEASGIGEGVRERIQNSASHVAAGAKQGAEMFQRGMAEAENVIQERPGQSIAVAFGLGLVAGIGASLLLRERKHQTPLARGRDSAGQYANQLVDKLGDLVAEFKSWQR